VACIADSSRRFVAVTRSWLGSHEDSHARPRNNILSRFTWLQKHRDMEKAKVRISRLLRELSCGMQQGPHSPRIPTNPITTIPNPKPPPNPRLSNPPIGDHPVRPQIENHAMTHHILLRHWIYSSRLSSGILRNHTAYLPHRPRKPPSFDPIVNRGLRDQSEP